MSLMSISGGPGMRYEPILTRWTDDKRVLCGFKEVSSDVTENLLIMTRMRYKDV